MIKDKELDLEKIKEKYKWLSETKRIPQYAISDIDLLVKEVGQLQKFEWMYQASIDDHATIMGELEKEVKRLRGELKQK